MQFFGRRAGCVFFSDLLPKAPGRFGCQCPVFYALYQLIIGTFLYRLPFVSKAFLHDLCDGYAFKVQPFGFGGFEVSHKKDGEKFDVVRGVAKLRPLLPRDGFPVRPGFFKCLLRFLCGFQVFFKCGHYTRKACGYYVVIFRHNVRGGVCGYISNFSQALHGFPVFVPQSLV